MTTDVNMDSPLAGWSHWSTSEALEKHTSRLFWPLGKEGDFGMASASEASDFESEDPALCTDLHPGTESLDP